MSTPAAGGQRFVALDAWRGLCALVVAIEHVQIANPLVTNAFVHRGYRFVDFFFVLSGFVIAHAYGARLFDGAARGRFLARRLGRLWPLHAFVLGVLVLLEVGLAVASAAGVSVGREPFGERATLASIPLHLLLVQGWGVLPGLTWNGPSWSISTEFAAYGLFALISVVALRTRLVVAAVLGAAGAAIVWRWAPEGMGSTFDFGLPRCVFGFMVGVIVRAAWGRWPVRGGTALELGTVVAVVGGVAMLPTGAPALLVTPLFALAVWVFAGEDGAVSRLLGRRVPQALGAWSYSIYMVHATLVLVLLIGATLATRLGVPIFARVEGVAMIVGPAWFTTVLLATYLLVVVGLARLTYLHVELPGQRWVARRLERRR
ncbi:MAG: acyltransferase [Kofleriaceae bacterium]